MGSEARRGALYSDLIVEALTRYGDRTAFVSAGRTMTYAEAADLTGRYSRLLAGVGVTRGSGVGALGTNSPEMWLVQAAAYLLGARFTGLNVLGSTEDHARIVRDADIDVLLVDADRAVAAAQVVDLSGREVALWTLGPAPAGQDVGVLLADVAPGPLLAGPAQAEDVAWLQYTGGTTGTPKGVMLTQSAMAQQVQSWLSSYAFPECPRYLASAPITHAAVLAVVPTLVRGGTVVLLEGFDPATYLQAVQDHRVNYAFAVPTMLYALLDHGHVSDYDLSSLQVVQYGTAPISPSRLVELIEAFGPVFLQGYGQTESLGTITTLHPAEHDPVGRPELLTSCGRPVVGVVVAVLDQDGKPVPDGQPGEICVRSAAVMAGYRNQPELTAAALAGGWLHTGDVGIRDARGYYHLVDRLKDVVITGGFNVYPREIEDVLTAHDSISAAAVIGIPHERWGEAVQAYVVLKAGAVPDVQGLIAHVRARKGAHHAPKGVTVLERLPTTAVGKVDKKALRAMHWGAGERQVH